MTPPPQKNFVPQHPFHQTPTRSHSPISITRDSPMLHQLLWCIKPDVNCGINMKKTYHWSPSTVADRCRLNESAINSNIQSNAACTASATSSASGISASCISSSLGHLMNLTRLSGFHNQFTLNQFFCGGILLLSFVWLRARTPVGCLAAMIYVINSQSPPVTVHRIQWSFHVDTVNNDRTVYFFSDPASRRHLGHPDPLNKLRVDFNFYQLSTESK